jgi:phage tail sheath gpL-like
MIEFKTLGYESVYNQLPVETRKAYSEFVAKHRGAVANKLADDYLLTCEIHLLNEVERELSAVNRKIQYKAWMCNEATYARRSTLNELRNHFRLTLGVLFSHKL